MSTPRTVLLPALALLGLAGAALADPGKDESGKGRERGSYAQGGVPGLSDDRPRRARAEGAIPRGHLPRPGECRTWMEGVPAGQQKAPYRC